MKEHIERFAGVGGSEIAAYTLDNERGLRITAIDFGATLVSVRHSLGGKEDEVLLGFSDVSLYQQLGSFVGSTVGRVANRIKGGLIKIDGAEYPLVKNFGEHTLHGGAGGFAYRPWAGEIVAADDKYGGAEAGGASARTIRFTLESPHLDDGFPGALSVVAEYTLTADNRLVIEHRAEADRDTVVNLTHHGYWNLAGDGDVAGHRFQINADSYMQTDDEGMPDGELAGVAGGRYDFRVPRAAIADLRAPELYDVCYHMNGMVLDGLPVAQLDGDLSTVALVVAPAGVGGSGGQERSMLISSDYPACQFFLPIEMPVPPVPDGFVSNGAFCLECMFHVDALRFPNAFPTTILRKGAVYHQRTVHQFN